MKDSGKVLIHGKEYTTVASRVNTFRETYKDKYSIETEIISVDDKVVIMKATIRDDLTRIVATGHAEEDRTASTINRTSALENCETSAIGRALAGFGMAGTEFASADEVATAITHQNEPRQATRPASDKQRELIKTKLNEIGIALEDQPGYLIEQFGVSIPLDVEQASFVIEGLL